MPCDTGSGHLKTRGEAPHLPVHKAAICKFRGHERLVQHVGLDTIPACPVVAHILAGTNLLEAFERLNIRQGRQVLIALIPILNRRIPLKFLGVVIDEIQ